MYYGVSISRRVSVSLLSRAFLEVLFALSRFLKVLFLTFLAVSAVLFLFRMLFFTEDLTV